jgi:TPP-dependent pyruvate/acetoin dehydrogenase alpha subunit
MKYKTFILTLTFITASVITSKVQAQYRNESNNTELDRKDSLETVRNEVKMQETKDENAIANAKADKKETKAKAKKAKRIEREANDAAKESKYALRSERKAQKSRKQANDQAKKASKAREKSDQN